MAHTNAGIDYGMGLTNVDRDTGIRYGVISSHDILQAWADSSEAYYGEPETETDEESDGFDEYAEPISFTFTDDGIQAEQSANDTDVFITLSPFYTFAPFCSPCAPGAGYLSGDTPHDESDGVKTYCFGHDWFDDGKAPYRVYRVSDDSEVVAE